MPDREWSSGGGSGNGGDGWSGYQNDPITSGAVLSSPTQEPQSKSHRSSASKRDKKKKSADNGMLVDISDTGKKKTDWNNGWEDDEAWENLNK